MRLLLIEDSRDIALALRQVLAVDYDMTHAETGQDGLRQAQNQRYDIIMLDLNLPDMAGLQVCQTLRAGGCTTPILILTGDRSVMSKIRLLDAGADDYLTKPFSLGELKARLRVLQRHNSQARGMELPQLAAGDLVLNKSKHTVQREGRLIKLRRKEFALLECLIRHADTVVTRSALGNYAWQGSDTPWTNTIDVHIKHLRDKIDRPFERQLIRTVHGLGYKLESRSAAAPLEALECAIESTMS